MTNGSPATLTMTRRDRNTPPIGDQIAKEDLLDLIAITMTTGIKGRGMAIETRIETRGQNMTGGGLIMGTETENQNTTFVTGTSLKITQGTGLKITGTGLTITGTSLKITGTCLKITGTGGPPPTGGGTLTATSLTIAL